ncbi:hypothetical protein RHSIM_Rhsim11G0020800 [Rhododendron simsii]|uniref:Uncharacterized protein n=1 Tax=Rhododendron simsii TaxID=118357 RepID=A0A834GCH7_RHOSS|nr:hypothetical protein RHSIM_Rhsim11G0020800 [Rhododendron simsii]
MGQVEATGGTEVAADGFGSGPAPIYCTASVISVDGSRRSEETPGIRGFLAGGNFDRLLHDFFLCFPLSASSAAVAHRVSCWKIELCWDEKNVCMVPVPIEASSHRGLLESLALSTVMYKCLALHACILCARNKS